MSHVPSPSQPTTPAPSKKGQLAAINARLTQLQAQAPTLGNRVMIVLLKAAIILLALLPFIFFLVGVALMISGWTNDPAPDAITTMVGACIVVGVLTLLAIPQTVVNFATAFENIRFLGWLKDRTPNQITTAGRTLSILAGVLGLLALIPAAFIKEAEWSWVTLPLASILAIEIYFFALRESGKFLELQDNLASTGRLFRRLFLGGIVILILVLLVSRLPFAEALYLQIHSDAFANIGRWLSGAILLLGVGFGIWLLVKAAKSESMKKTVFAVGGAFALFGLAVGLVYALNHTSIRRASPIPDVAQTAGDSGSSDYKKDMEALGFNLN